MERQEFLKSLGISLAVVCAGSCLSACGGKGDTGTPNVTPNPAPNPGGGGGGASTASADISTTLASIGSQTKVNGVLFFRIAAGSTTSSFVATESICPHQSGGLSWLNAENKIQCDLHRAEYTAAGTVTQGPQNSSGNTRALKIYATTISGNIITATIA